MTRDRRLEAVVWALAAHRATRLVTADVLTRKPRDRIVKWSYLRSSAAYQRSVVEGWEPALGWSALAEDDSDAPYLATLVTCRWCASVWLTAGLMLAAYVLPGPARVLRWLLAGSSAAVLIARIEE